MPKDIWNYKLNNRRTTSHEPASKKQDEINNVLAWSTGDSKKRQTWNKQEKASNWQQEEKIELKPAMRALQSQLQGCNMKQFMHPD